MSFEKFRGFQEFLKVSFYTKVQLLALEGEMCNQGHDLISWSGLDLLNRSRSIKSFQNFSQEGARITSLSEGRKKNIHVEKEDAFCVHILLNLKNCDLMIPRKVCFG